MKPPAATASEAYPSGVNPRPLMWECGAMRADVREEDEAEGGGRGALWAGAADVEVPGTNEAIIRGWGGSVGDRSSRLGGFNNFNQHATAMAIGGPVAG
jgi:hypothetical protein